MPRDFTAPTKGSLGGAGCKFTLSSLAIGETSFRHSVQNIVTQRIHASLGYVRVLGKIGIAVEETAALQHPRQALSTHSRGERPLPTRCPLLEQLIDPPRPAKFAL